MTLGEWTSELVDAECGRPHAAYKRRLEAAYIAYFAAHPHLADEHRFKAASLRAALPNGFGDLESELPAALRHRHHLSGGSSQVMALGMLGAAARIDPSLAWLSAALTLPPFSASTSKVQFAGAADPKCGNRGAHATRSPASQSITWPTSR